MIKADLLATMEGCDPVRWAVAIREHGSGQPFRLFQGIAHLTFRVTLGEVSVAEPAWG